MPLCGPHRRRGFGYDEPLRTTRRTSLLRRPSAARRRRRRLRNRRNTAADRLSCQWVRRGSATGCVPAAFYKAPFGRPLTSSTSRGAARRTRSLVVEEERGAAEWFFVEGCGARAPPLGPSRLGSAAMPACYAAAIGYDYMEVLERMALFGLPFAILAVRTDKIVALHLDAVRGLSLAWASGQSSVKLTEPHPPRAPQPRWKRVTVPWGRVLRQHEPRVCRRSSPQGPPAATGPPTPPPVPELDAAVVAAADLERGLAMTVAVSPYLVLRSTCSWRVSSGPLLLAIWRRTCTVPAVGGCLLAMTCPTWLCAVPAVGGCLLGHCRLLLDAGPAQYLQYLAMSWHSWACAVPAVGGCLLGLCCLLLDAGGSQPLLALCQL